MNVLMKLFFQLEELKPIAKNVWEYMIINSNDDNNITLDEKTQNYINNHNKKI